MPCCRLAALADGIDPPENMRRCFANNYDIEVRAETGGLRSEAVARAGHMRVRSLPCSGVLAGMALQF